MEVEKTTHAAVEGKLCYRREKTLFGNGNEPICICHVEGY